MKLRAWQESCVKAAFNFYQSQKHFFCLATPASGKTIMSAMLAKQLKEAKLIDFVICFSPSATVCENMRETFTLITGKRFDGLIGAFGDSHTYQSLRTLNDEYLCLLNESRTLVILDEVHHCAGDSIENANSWGKGILERLKENATYTLSLSGTPWRSDCLPITLAHYSDNITCHFQYGLREAISDGVCRTPNIVLIDNKNIKVIKHNEEELTFPSFIDLFKQKLINYSELIHHSTALNFILKKANQKLQALRKHDPSSAGLIVASSTAHAYILQRLMKDELNQHAVVVTYKNTDALQIINQFKISQVPWIISVGMISEGTDIPRLQVCCHLSRVKTELYFRQILGRVLRVTNNINDNAWLYTFAEPNLRDFADRLQEEVPEQSILTHFDVTSEKGLTENKGKNLPKKLSDGVDGIDLILFDEFENSPNNGDCQMRLNKMELIGGFREKIIATFS